MQERGTKAGVGPASFNVGSWHKEKQKHEQKVTRRRSTDKPWYGLGLDKSYLRPDLCCIQARRRSLALAH